MTGATSFRLEHGQIGCACQRAFFFENIALSRRPAGAAYFGRPLITQPALFVEHCVPYLANFGFDKDRGRGFRTIEYLGRQFFAQKSADFVAKGQLLRVKNRDPFSAPLPSRPKPPARRKHGYMRFSDFREPAARRRPRAVARHSHRLAAIPMHQSARRKQGSRHRY